MTPAEATGVGAADGGAEDVGLMAGAADGGVEAVQIAGAADGGAEDVSLAAGAADGGAEGVGDDAADDGAAVEAWLRASFLKSWVSTLLFGLVIAAASASHSRGIPIAPRIGLICMCRISGCAKTAAEEARC